MLTSGFPSPANSPLSRSGVHLDYAPEDTLKSFVMEKRLNPNSDSSQLITKNSLNGKAIDTGAPVGGNDSVKVKRPFLRKNQGRAAWCSRLRSPSNKIITNVDNSRKSLLNSNENQKMSSGNSKPLYNEIKCRKTESVFQPFINMDSCDSANNSHKPMKCLSNSTYLKKNENHVISNNTLNTTGDERELAEFEILERLTENHLNALDAKRSTCDSAEKSPSVDGVLHNGKQMNNNGVIINNSADRELGFGHENRIKFSSTRPIKPHLSAIESTSVECDDQEPWEDEDNLDSLTSSVEATPCRQQSLPSVRFNIPDEPSESHHEKENCVDLPLNSSKEETVDKSSASVKVWIARLEAEVNRFNAETGTLIRLRTEKEQALSALEKERKEFENFKETTMKEFESYRQDEINKLKRERKVLSDYQKSLQTMPQKRDREEIERLKQQLSDEKVEAAQRETRLQHQLGRQRLRIEELITEKNELLERIKRLEESRLAMQNTIAEERANHSLNGSNKLHRNFKSQNQIDSITQSITFPQFNTKSPNPLNADTQEPKVIRAISAGSVSRRSALTLAVLPSSKSINGNLNVEETPTNSLPIHLLSQPSSENISGCNESSNSISRTPLSSRSLPERNRGPILREIRHPDGSFERLYCDGSRTIGYANGSAKEISPDGVSSTVYLFNGDTKQTMEDGTVIYKYAADGTVQTTKLDGTEEIVYNDGRRETNYSQETMPTSNFSNSQHQQLPLPTTYRRGLNSKNSLDRPEIVEESRYPDGISVQIFANGDKIISLPNGQREIHCSEFKRRIYPDGTVKTVFSDGRQETRYASGRVRVKDSDGNLLVDTRIAPVSQNAASNLAPLLSLTSCLQTPR
nr:centromere protein j [Hymenolepis microstoma]